MLKAQAYSLVEPYEDEDGKTWETTMLIWYPDIATIHIETAFGDAVAAQKWCDDFNELLHGSHISIEMEEGVRA